MAGMEHGTELCLAPGTVLPGNRCSYRVLRILGQGGFGITYGCEQDDGTLVALKEYFPITWAMRSADMTVVPRPDRENEYRTGLDRFSGEARMLTSFKPLPAVVSVLDCFYGNGTAYIVMEFLDGQPLHTKMAEMGGRIPPEELLPKLPPLLMALEELHQSGVLHRDIAPDNIMWMPDNTLKLMDFGSARRMEGNQHLTVMIKPGFAPVEQYTTSGQGSYTDVYALCATVYYLITGTKPPLSYERLEGDALVAPCELGVALTPEEEQALLHGLQVQPKHRTQSMDELLRELFPPIIPASTTFYPPDDQEIEPLIAATQVLYDQPADNDPLRFLQTLPRWMLYAGAGVVAVLLVLLGAWLL